MALGIPDGVHHAGQGCEADISASVRDPGIVGSDPYPLVTLGAIPLRVVDTRCDGGSLTPPGFREVFIYDLVESGLVILDIVCSTIRITSHNEEPSSFVHLHTS